MIRIVPTVAGLALAGLLLCVSPARAETLNAFDVPASITTKGNTGNFVVGFEFTVSETILLTHLGKLDWYGNGLGEAAPIGIWKTTQTAAPLVSTTIPAGTAADLDEFSGHGSLHYYYESVAPVRLYPGRYRIGVASGSEVSAYDLTGISWNGPISWTLGVADTGSTLGYPDAITYAGAHSYMGPNFKFETLPPLPEPTGDLLEDIRNGHPRTIVTMGTSLTASSNANWVSQMTAWLKDQAPDPNAVSVVNVGVGASSSNNANAALSGIQTQLPNAKAQNPDVVLIEFGINDAYLPYSISQQQSKDNLELMIDQLQAQNPDVQIVLMTMNNPIGVHLTNRPEVAAYYQGYRDVAQTRGLTLIDHYPNWLDLYGADAATWNRYVPDGIHPNAAGAVNVILPQLRRSLDGEVTLALGGFENIDFSGNFSFFTHDSGMGVWSVENHTGAGNALVLWNADRLQAAFPDIDASEGSQMVTLQAGNNLATIRQTFDTVPGREYEVTFDLTALVGTGGGASLPAQTLSLQVSAAGEIATFSIDTPPPTNYVHTLPYQSQTFRFTATEASTTLALSNQTVYLGDVNWGLTVDNVRVAPVPEPTSLLLGLTAVSLLLFLGRWR